MLLALLSARLQRMRIALLVLGSALAFARQPDGSSLALSYLGAAHELRRYEPERRGIG